MYSVLWTVVDILACGVKGPGYNWGGWVDIMECLFFPLSWCCTYDLKGGSFCVYLFWPPGWLAR